MEFQDALKTHEDMKKMSIYMYNKTFADPPEGYKVVEIAINNKTGFKAAALKRVM